MTDSGVDTDVEMLAEDFEALNCTPEMDVVFGFMAESEDEYNSWRDRVHTCFCRSEDCVSCAVRDCPHHEPLHYHHDGCPECRPPLVTPRTITVEFGVDGVRFCLPVYE